MSIHGADVARVLRPALADGPVEVTIVGDVDEASAVSQVAATFGALPPRRGPSRARADAWFLRFPEHPPQVVRATHDGRAEKALVALVWPLYVGDPSRRREEVSLHLLAGIYQDMLLRRLRAELGKSYSPSASVQMEDQSDQGTLRAAVETTPADLDVVRAEMTRIAGDLAHGNLTPADLDDFRTPLLSRLDQNARSNDWWAEKLMGSTLRDSGLKDAVGLRALVVGIGADEVRKAAATWLTPPPVVVIVTGRAAASPPTGAAS